MAEEFEETKPKNNNTMYFGAGAVIILVILAGIFFFDGTGFNTDKTKVLVIGSSSQEVIDVLNANRATLDYDSRTVSSLSANPSDTFKGYKIIMLDQSEEASKEVTKLIGDSLQDFVKKGGNLIVVKDSGIRRPDSFDIIGWENTFGNIVPAACDRTINDQPTCTTRLLVQGKLVVQEKDHPIVKGIDYFPADPNLNARFELFDISVNGKEIAYIESSGIDGKSYPAIVEKKSIIGKVIYFNYNPGKTRGIFESTLEYLS